MAEARDEDADRPIDVPTAAAVAHPDAVALDEHQRVLENDAIGMKSTSTWRVRAFSSSSDGSVIRASPGRVRSGNPSDVEIGR